MTTLILPAIINWASSSIWLLLIPCIIALAYGYHRIQLRKINHQKKELESKSVKLEALLYYSKENEKKSKEETASLHDFYKQLLGKLNHEIRNPLNGVSGMSTLLEETSISAEQRGYIQSIRNCSNDVMDAVNHLFTAAGVTHGSDKQNAGKTIEKETGSSCAKPAIKLSTEFATHYPLKILVAEDDTMNQQLAVMILKRLGYSADVAPNGKEVLEMVGENKYDLILMDVQMPEMDGLQATRMLRVSLNVQPVIIAMTANAMEGDREACLASGMDDYISKPVNMEELMEKLEEQALGLNEKNNH